MISNYSLKGGASSIQNFRFISGLKKIGMNLDIVTKREKLRHSDNSIFEIPAPQNRLLTSIFIRILPDLVHLPDLERFFWTKQVIKRLKNFVSVDNYDWVHTTSSPQSIHFIGYYLKKNYGKPWVAHFYDPWSDNNFREFKIPYFKKLDQKMERKVAENADLIIHTNSIIYQKWVERYGDKIKEKMMVLPLCTDEKIAKKKIKKQNDKFIILHTGGIYGTRTLDDIIDVLLLLQKKKEYNLLKRIEIRQVGLTKPKELKKVKDKNLLGYFKFYGRQSYNFVLSESNKANVLLLIDDNSIDNVFFPSKLCEYFSFNKPIIGIVSKNSVARELLEESNQFYVAPGNSLNLAKTIKELMNNETKYSNISPKFHERFLPVNIAYNYKKAIIDMIQN